MGTPGATELLIVLAIVLLILGPKRLPGLGRQLGGGLREFKDAITGSSRHRDDADEPARGGHVAAGDDDGESVDGQVVRERRPS